tara:strand:- start:10623 stop:10886 length:264 start_codon:yes stop_codon:yes gene_type:complete
MYRRDGKIPGRRPSDDRAEIRSCNFGIPAIPGGQMSSAEPVQGGTLFGVSAKGYLAIMTAQKRKSFKNDALAINHRQANKQAATFNV